MSGFLQEAIQEHSEFSGIAFSRPAQPVMFTSVGFLTSSSVQTNVFQEWQLFLDRSGFDSSASAECLSLLQSEGWTRCDLCIKHSNEHHCRSITSFSNMRTNLPHKYWQQQVVVSHMDMIKKKQMSKGILTQICLM